MALARSVLLYVGLTKPRIIFLLDFVAATSLLAAYFLEGVSGSFAVSLFHVLVAGSLASAAASSFNAYYDRDLDLLMARTKTRPVPSGQIAAGKALLFSVVLTGVAFGYSFVFLKPVAAGFIVFGYVTYVLVYTVWLKRRSSWNIVVGGFAGSCASLAGWSEASGTVSLAAALMGLIVFLWTPSHFWSLAIRVSQDYGSVGVPMLPQVVGVERAAQIIVVNTLILLASSVALFLWGGLGWIYLGASLALGLLLLFFDLRTMVKPSSTRAFTAFKVSSPYLALLFVAIVLDVALR